MIDRYAVTRKLRFVLQPLCDWRGRIVCRTFTDETRFYDRHVRAVVEWVMDRIEMWEMKPSFDRMQAQIDDMNKLGRELELIRIKYGLSDDGRLPHPQEEKKE